MLHGIEACAGPCGSELARESGVSGALILAVPAPSRASSLPQWICGVARYCEPMQNPCGSELARESGGSGDIDVGMRRPLREQARSHNGFVVWHGIASLCKTPVGASLLAKAVGQATLMLDMPAPSRAGSLPQWICGVARY
ncbi:hypothetical protein FHK92_28180 [Pseudomonas brassicacearum subsp. neoaurantiaca]|uniref:Uncharacterized protein n=1 Tax=Pseudomonas brassicacearum subsp. neoaurantiaca TaxID=494916 RepID=A0A7V8UHD6_9PSED|nr:hypothetical protein [Pseudomonas brassicacearum subsp. neoaurantiaca]